MNLFRFVFCFLLALLLAAPATAQSPTPEVLATNTAGAVQLEATVASVVQPAPDAATLYDKILNTLVTIMAILTLLPIGMTIGGVAMVRPLLKFAAGLAALTPSKTDDEAVATIAAAYETMISRLNHMTVVLGGLQNRLEAMNPPPVMTPLQPPDALMTSTMQASARPTPLTKVEPGETMIATARGIEASMPGQVG